MLPMPSVASTIFTQNRIQGQTGIIEVNEALCLDACQGPALKLFPQAARILAALSAHGGNGKMMRGRLMPLGSHYDIAAGERLCG